MHQIIECVANVSEGRNLTVLGALGQAIWGVRDVELLDRHTDRDHHRSVFTFAGKPIAVIQAAFELVRTAVPLIDLNAHTGQHPRVGAVDVVPLIPLKGATLIDCAKWAQELGSRIGSNLHVPVFLYGEASVIPTRKRLEVIRRGALKGLASRMASDPLWTSDFGPAKPHRTAGVVVVGTRHPLIAFNIVLDTADVFIAQSIAQTIRTSGGGLPSLKALGIELASRGLVQVSMNLTNYHETSIQEAFNAVQQEAGKFQIRIQESEIVGLIPQAALPLDILSELRLGSWNPNQVLETRLSQVGLA